MPLYKWEGNQFKQFEEPAFEREREFENLLEQDADFLLDNEQLLIIGRQVPIHDEADKNAPKCDLLALDRDANCVIIELKREKATRTVIAQALEYAASVSKLGYDELNRITRETFRQQGKPYKSLLALHNTLFDIEPGSMRGSSFNQKQRIIIIAEGADKRLLEVAEYLRGYGVDITYISYFSYRKADEILVNTETLLGYPVISETQESYTVKPEGQTLTRQIFLERLSNNEELCKVAEKFFEYVDECGATLRKRTELVRFTIGGKWWIDAYASKRGTHFRVNIHGDFPMRQVAECRKNLPDVTLREFGISFNITSQAELEYAIQLFEKTRNLILEGYA